MMVVPNGLPDLVKPSKTIEKSRKTDMLETKDVQSVDEQKRLVPFLRISDNHLTGLFAISGYSRKVSGRCFVCFQIVFRIVFDQFVGQNFEDKSP